MIDVVELVCYVYIRAVYSVVSRLNWITESHFDAMCFPYVCRIPTLRY